MNKSLKAIAAVLVLAPALVAGGALAAETGYTMRSANVDLGDRASLQSGAKYFMNYCLSCHSANYMRYKRMARDLGLTDQEVEQNLMFASDKIGSTMTVALQPEQGKKWFGAPPPDLSVRARARGADWIYNYLLTFYLDPSRPWGVNNVVFPNTAMPDVVWHLQGLQKADFKTVKNADGQDQQVLEKLEITQPGTLNPAQYRRAVRDITAFLVYVGEPAKLVRYGIGGWVLLFLALFFVLSYVLYKEYWKDVH